MRVTAGAVPVKPYKVTVSGYDPIVYYAATAGKARAKAWRDFTAAYECSFRDFLSRSTVCKGEPGAGYGEKILVEGRAAFRVPDAWGGRRIAFVWPDSDRILMAHPRDVQRCERSEGRHG